MGKPLKISEEAAVQMPMKTVASLIAMVAIGTWAYFGIIETQNKIQTTVELMSKDLTENTEFRIKWPRGQLGSLPADSEQFMMIEDLYKTVDRINKAIEDGMHNKVNIEFLQKQVEKLIEDVEKLKDKIVFMGFAKSFEDYASWLWKANILLVTSNQDFFGGSVIEAIYCNCYPILPDRLAYPEHLPNYPHLYFNSFDKLCKKLENAILDFNNLESVRDFVKQYDWKELIKEYDEKLL